MVVAPLNLPVELAPDLEDAVDPVSAEMIRHLQSRGARVAVIFAPDAWALWRESAAAARRGREEAPELVEIARTFSLALRAHAHYDVLVLPSLVFRDAEVRGRFAHWDGVRRRIRFRARSGVPRGRAQPVPDPMALRDASASPAGEPEWRGRITGLSLHVLVLSSEGRGLFQGFGGLDLVHDPVQEREGSPDPPRLRLQTSLLESGEHVREGVARALDPRAIGIGRGGEAR